MTRLGQKSANYTLIDELNFRERFDLPNHSGARSQGAEALPRTYSKTSKQEGSSSFALSIPFAQSFFMTREALPKANRMEMCNHMYAPRAKVEQPVRKPVVAKAKVNECGSLDARQKTIPNPFNKREQEEKIKRARDAKYAFLYQA